MLQQNIELNQNIMLKQDIVSGLEELNLSMAENVRWEEWVWTFAYDCSRIMKLLQATYDDIVKQGIVEDVFHHALL